MKKFIGILVILAIISAIVAPRVIDLINKESETTEDINVITVSGQQVVKGDISNDVELISKTNAKQVVNVMPLVTAKVETVMVEVGDHVLKDDVLFTLDASSIDDQVTQAEIGVTLANVGVKNANATINQATIGYDLAKSSYEIQYANYEFGVNNLEKYEQLYLEGIVSETELEQMRLQSSPESLKLLEKQLEQAGAALSQAKLGTESANASLHQATEGHNSASDMLEDMVVVAPIDGYITASTVVVDNYATTAQPAMVVQDMNEIIVSANVTEGLVNSIAIGDVVEVIIESVGDVSYEGTVKTLSTSAGQMTLLFPLTVTIDNSDNTVKPGMFATIKIVKEISKNALYVPGEAILIRKGENYVYVQRGDKVERVAVTTGIDTGYFVEILEGVTIDDVVITKGIGLIDENSTIKVIRSDQ